MNFNLLFQNFKVIFFNIIAMSVPIISLSPHSKNIAKAIRSTCKNTGFFYVENHGVPLDLLKTMT